MCIKKKYVFNIKMFMVFFGLNFFGLSGVSQNLTSGASNQLSADGIRKSIDRKDRMDWFNNARLGVFIHWGVYSVRGIAESWSFFNETLPYSEYMDQLNGFTAENYNPEKWAELIKKSGAKYVVTTSKHHDGVALWDTKGNDLSIPKKTPAKRDVLSPLVSALRKNNIKVGMYYSLMDWSHSDFPAKNRKTSKNREFWEYDPAKDTKRWDRFMDFNFTQYREIAENYSPDLWWFDGHWWFTEKEWKSKETAKLVFENNPNAVINSRLPGYGDYLTPEQGMPLKKPSEMFEVCMTMNNSWGYQSTDKNYKSTFDVINLLTDCIHMGGNLLLDIGPKPDGTIPKEQVKILEGLGRWTKKHEKAIYNTKAGIDCAYYNGGSAIGSADYLGMKHATKDILYLFVPNNPNGDVRLKGLKNRIERAWVVGNGTYINWRQDPALAHPGIVYLDVPKSSLDQDVTVLALMLDGKINLQSFYKTQH